MSKVVEFIENISTPQTFTDELKQSLIDKADDLKYTEYDMKGF